MHIFHMNSYLPVSFILLGPQFVSVQLVNITPILLRFMVYIYRTTSYSIHRGYVHQLILVGGLEHFLFFHIVGMSSSQLTFIFFRWVGQPPTIFIDYP